MTDNSVFGDLLEENRTFPPSDTFRDEAVGKESLYAEADKDILAYWERHARELEWFEPWTEVMEWTPPHVKWFTGGKLNMSYNCLDRHLKTDRRHKAAIIWEGEDGAEKTLTYLQLHREVCLCANMLKSLGVGRGDRVAIYMPMLVETAVVMLACARIGAIHSVVFGGFAPDSLSDRINDSDCKLLVTADGGYRRGKVLSLKSEADIALEHTPTIENVLVVQRRPEGPFETCTMKPGRDHFYHTLRETVSASCEPEHMDAEDVLFILYTSGTTGTPKGIVHTTGGYSVGTYTTSKYVFDLKDTDVYWCTADVGWITGHSYIVYGPLQTGATILMYEGAPDFPNKSRFWDICERHQVSIFYTAPTAIRAFMKWGDEHIEGHDLSSLRVLGSVGEPINPEAWVWYHKVIGKERCPIVDTWWQTETGAMMITGLPGVTSMKPGFAGPPVPGIQAAILDEKGNELKNGSGLLGILHPWPSMLRTIWGNDERFVRTYFSKWDKRIYFPGDGAKRDEHGNFMILGRVDDVLNVSGHRIGTMEVESALVEHEKVAEAAVVGGKHEIKGQAIVAFVSLIGGAEPSEELRKDIRGFVAHKIGALARPERVIFAADLPKTRSGKIMRRLLRDIADGKAIGDTTTLADPSVVDRLRTLYEDA